MGMLMVWVDLEGWVLGRHRAAVHKDETLAK